MALSMHMRVISFVAGLCPGAGRIPNLLKVMGLGLLWGWVGGPGWVRAEIQVGPWTALYKGVEHAVGRVDTSGPQRGPVVVNVLRVDLQDPDVELFATPPLTNNYLRGIRETGALGVSDFVRKYRLQVAINANFFEPNEVDTLETPQDVLGLHVSQGRVVSVIDDTVNRSSILLLSNRTAQAVFTNTPSRSLAGVHTAVTGRYPLVINGVNVANNARSEIPGLEPRTAVGVTEDGRYLLLMTIDGRQPAYSIGTEDEDTADWMILFGAYHAVNMDGGGSSTMVMADLQGDPLRMNQPSYLLGRGRERYVGSHLGVYAKPLEGVVRGVRVRTVGDSAVCSWETTVPATVEVDWGQNPGALETLTVSASPALKHSLTLSNLVADTTYCVRVRAVVENEEVRALFCFKLEVVREVLFPFSQVWEYTTNNLDGVAWTAPGYSTQDWLGQGPGLLHVEDNPNTAPKGTLLPPKTLVNPKLPVTYYFRTRFQLTHDPSRLVSLVFSNYIDDGAVFYLNGKEIQRVRMPEFPAEIKWATLAKSYSCVGDATVDCPTVFTVGADALSKLVKGTNVLSVEVHNYNVNSPDVVFGTTLIAQVETVPVDVEPPVLTFGRDAGGGIVLNWEGTGFTLQSASALGEPVVWEDVAGPVVKGPYGVPLVGSARYFRLRQ